MNLALDEVIAMGVHVLVDEALHDFHGYWCLEEFVETTFQDFVYTHGPWLCGVGENPWTRDVGKGPKLHISVQPSENDEYLLALSFD